MGGRARDAARGAGAPGRQGVAVGALKRRGLLAGAMAMAAAGLAKVAQPPPARAEHSADDGLLHFAGSSTNMPSARAYAQLQNVGETEFVIGVDGFAASSTVHAYGLRGGISNFGGSRGAGIFGSAAAASGNQAAGVYGFADAASLNVHPNRAAAVGVHGLSNNRLGVRGDSRQSIGVLGVSGTSAETVAPPSGQFGVAGISTSAVGTTGISTSAAGVYGFSANGPGLYAYSATAAGAFVESTQTAVWGRSGAGTGVFGQSTNRGIGVYGFSSPPGWAGYFEGNVYVTGIIVQAGDSAASSSIRASDGTTRTVYSQDSTEPVVEDFGEAKLAGGRALVMLDPGFATVADGAAYQVFLTEYGDLGTIYVADRTPGGFEIRSRSGASGSVGYRVVARRKGAAGKRLDRLEPPKRPAAGDIVPPPRPDVEPPVAPVGGQPTIESSPTETPKRGRIDAR